LLRWQLGGEVRPVAHNERPHLVIDGLDHIEGFNLATDGGKLFCRNYTASENLIWHLCRRSPPRAFTPSGQKACLGLQPLTDDAGASLAISRPVLREAVPSDIVGFDAEGLLYDLGGAIAVVGADGLFE
jgi:hypothetical protein